MEDKKMDSRYTCDVCGSGMDGRCRGCGHYCGFRGGHILRWVLGILIITWVFSIGMKIGELKSFLENGGYGYGYPHERYNVMPMMGGNAGYFNAPAGSGEVIYTSSAQTLPKK